MLNIFDINTVAFTVMDYPMSYLEFIGTIFNLWCVWLTAKGKISSWPIGIVGVIFYIFLFYQINLYSDLFEQFYFLITSFYGWYLWLNLKGKKERNEGELKITKNTLKSKITYITITLLGTLLLTYFMKNVHLYFPTIFTEPASYPFIDAFTTVLSFVATILLAKKKVDSWILWILVDIIGIWLYYVKGVKFISLEYLIFLGLATNGLFKWKKELKSYEKANKNNKGVSTRKIRPST